MSCVSGRIPEAFVYLKSENLEQALQPEFLFNFSCSDDIMTEEFCHVPTRLLPRCCLPPEMGNLGSAYMITGEKQSMVRAAVLQGRCFLTVPQIQAIIAALALPELTVTTESGKKRAPRKPELCQHLIRGLFPHATAEEQKSMLAGLLGQSQAEWKDEEQAVVQMVAELDPENAREFEPLRRMAKQKMEDRQTQENQEKADAEVKKRVRACMEEAEARLATRMQEMQGGSASERLGEAAAPRAGGAAAAAAADEARAPRTPGFRRSAVTAVEFKMLLPGRGDIQGEFYPKSDRDKKFYKVEYPCALDLQYCGGFSRHKFRARSATNLKTSKSWNDVRVAASPFRKCCSSSCVGFRNVLKSPIRARLLELRISLSESSITISTLPD